LHGLLSFNELLGEAVGGKEDPDRLGVRRHGEELAARKTLTTLETVA
jgi:hypothetical protein